MQAARCGAGGRSMKESSLVRCERGKWGTPQLWLPRHQPSRATEARARRQLTPALLGHSFRSYAYGMAVGVPA
jgi:hypothetical protein